MVNKSSILEHIKNKNGELLTEHDRYITKTRINIKCENGHNFIISVDKLLYSNRWCQTCSRNKRVVESICKSYFEHFFQKKFPTTKPAWLKLQSKLELDGYNEELKLAFEYNGKQHYEQTYFPIDLNKIKKRDKFKINKCNEMNVTLVIIPYTIQINEIGQYIINKCRKLNLPLIKINIPDYKSLKIESSKLIELKNTALLKNGELLSDIYLGMNHRYSWKCNIHNIIWKTSANEIKNGSWCARCYGNAKLTIEEIGKILSDRNITITNTTSYKNRNSKLNLICNKCKYEWFTTYCTISNGSGCPKCGGTLKQSIEIVSDVCKSLNIKCLENIYINSSTKMNFECNKHKHRWITTFKKIKHGTKCPKCANLNKTKLKYNDYNNIVMLKKSGISIKEISKMFSISYNHTLLISKGYVPKHLYDNAILTADSALTNPHPYTMSLPGVPKSKEVRYNISTI